jgi:hypothetical protein
MLAVHRQSSAISGVVLSKNDRKRQPLGQGNFGRLTGELRTGLRPQSNRSARETLEMMWKVRDVTCRNRRSKGLNLAHEQRYFRAPQNQKAR